MAELTLGCYTADAAIAAAAVASSVSVTACVVASAAIILIQKLICWLLIEMTMASAPTVLSYAVAI